MSDGSMYDLASELLEFTTGLDTSTDHGEDTPKRFVNMLRELTHREDFNFTTFDNTEGVDEMVIIKDIPFYTLCNHHVIPFFGKAHIAYIPGQKIAGLSKFARTVKYFSKGLWVQENLTIAIADFLEDKLDPVGLAVQMEAEHLCMTMRGVNVPGATTTTGVMRGVFGDHSRTAKAEFLAAVNNGR